LLFNIPNLHLQRLVSNPCTIHFLILN